MRENRRGRAAEYPMGRHPGKGGDTRKRFPPSRPEEGRREREILPLPLKGTVYMSPS